jgi:Zn-dependent protease/CBS domain-containing protein
MFGRKFRLFKLMGFEVGVDPTWVILAILVAWSLSMGYFPFYYRNLSTQAYWIMGIVGAAGLFVSIIAHEFSHSLVARRLGMPMKGITLFIFGGVAEMGDEPPNARAEFWMALAGPVASLLIAAGFYGLDRLGAGMNWPLTLTAVAGYLAMINLVLAVFNLLPAYPLDGGRILRAALWAWKGDLRRATRIASQVGSGFGIALILLGVLRLLGGSFIGGMWLALIGLFIRTAAHMSYRQLLVRRALEGEPVSRFMSTDPVTVAPSATVEAVVEDYVYRFHHKLYPVVADGRLTGCVTTRQVKEVPRAQWARTTVGEIAVDCSPENTLAPDTDAVKALAAMQKNGASRMMVVRDGRLEGIVALKDLLGFLSLKIEFETG